MRPLPFIWPYWPVFWAVVIWAFSPEFRIVRKARKPATHSDSPDAGSFRVIVLGGAIASAIAFPLAWVPSLRLPTALAPAVFGIGVATIVAGGAPPPPPPRRFGASFSGGARAHPHPPPLTPGARAPGRPPPPTPGGVLNTSILLAL